MCDRTKFQQNWPDSFGDSTIVQFSRWPPSAIMDFEILKFWLTIILGSVICIAVSNFTKIGQTVAEIAFNIFQIGGHLPSWIFKSLIF